MPVSCPIVLATINAKYIHAAFGLRYLAANLGPLQQEAQILEFTGEQRAADMAEKILAHNPKVVGLGVYIWNAVQSLELVTILKAVAPQVKVILGGPEVSHELEGQAIVALADHVVTGEGEAVFRRLCESILSKRPSLSKVHPGESAALDDIVLPYALYTDDDIAHRVIYVEISRGCPFRCEFCLSSLDKKVRSFSLDEFLQAMDSLLARGVKQFKFVDRTFNLEVKTSASILDFFLARMSPGLFLHFEMVPDRFPDALRERISKFPVGSLQFEVGIQSFDPQVGERISRKQNFKKLEENLNYLRLETQVHVHTDLIIGLPGEAVECFARGFDHLVSLQVEEIQVGILKRLRGVPITRHSEEFAMVYAQSPPYEILSNEAIDFATMQRLKRFAQCWNSLVNRGNFQQSAAQIWVQSPFFDFLHFSDWLFGQAGRVHSIALVRLARYLLTYLCEFRDFDVHTISVLLRADFARAGRKDPGKLLPFELSSQGLAATAPSSLAPPRLSPPSRQARHLGVAQQQRE